MKNKEAVKIHALNLVFPIGTHDHGSRVEGKRWDEQDAQPLKAWLSEAIETYRPELIVVEFDCCGAVELKLNVVDTLCKLVKDTVVGKSTLRLKIVTDGAGIERRAVELMARLSLEAVICHVSSLAQDASTHIQRVAGIELLKNAARHDLIEPPTLRCVLDGTLDIDSLFRDIVTDSGFLDIDCHLPDRPGGEIGPELTTQISEKLALLFSNWSQAGGARNISVGMFDEFFQMLGPALTHQSVDVETRKNLAIIIFGDGTYKRAGRFEVIDRSFTAQDLDAVPLSSYLRQPAQQYLDTMEQHIASECSDCAWVGVCRSGNQHRGLIHRYDGRSGFQGKSVFCGALEDLFLNLARYLIQRGTSPQDLMAALEKLRNQASTASKSINMTPVFDTGT